MKWSNAIKLLAACAGITWATASFSQHSGHSSGNMQGHAHLTQTALMTPQQIAGYRHLRGYDQPSTR